MAEKKPSQSKRGASQRPARSPQFLVAAHQLSARGPTGVWNVVIETPRGSPHKYKYEPGLGAFALSDVLPEGMTFPYDFGFLPGTRAEDGDPLDVLLLMDEPAFCSCVVPARFIGSIHARQTEKGKTVRNDRLVAIPEAVHETSEFQSIKDLPQERLDQLEHFFVNYNREFGKRFRILSIEGPKKALRIARAAVKAGWHD